MPQSHGSKQSAAVSLQTHFLVFTLLMLVTVMTSSVLYYLRIRDDRTLENTVARDLHLLTLAPRLRAEMRQLAAGDPDSTTRRDRRIRRLEETEADVAPGPYGGAINGLLFKLRSEMALFLRKEEHGRATGAAERRRVNETLDEVSSGAINDLEKSLDKTRESTFHRMLVRLGIELLAASLIASYLYYFMVSPLSEIERTAERWRPGQTWSIERMRAIPELRSLLLRFSRSASDVNAQFRREQELGEFKTKLVSLVSHEFGNGLAVIQSCAFLLDESAASLDFTKRREFLSMIISNAKSLNSEVLNLLNMSRLEAGKLAITLAETDGEQVLRAVVDRLALLAKDKSLVVRVQIADGLRPVRADPSTLALVISNLLTNAIKYTPDRGCIDVGIDKELGNPDHYRFYVQDTGIGISENDSEKIFNDFYRAESGKRMAPKGFGIGLSLAKQIIQAHGSVLELRSAPGSGSRFSFLMPVWAQEDAAEAAALQQA